MLIKFFGAGSLIHDRGKPQLSALAQEILVRLTDGQTIKAIASDLGTTRAKVDWRVRTI
jgi:DNA-binding NarL/FixJ family response regulator